MQKKFHPNSFHNKDYDFDALIQSHKPLKQFVQKNKYDNISIDFSNEQAVVTLNQALLKYFYKIDFWQIPKGYLCPPIPGRVDYIHYLADLLQESFLLTSAKNRQIKGLDIGIGANGVYSLLGNALYEWQMVGSDIDNIALSNVQKIITDNHIQTISLRFQDNKSAIFDGIIQSDDYFDFIICNPPFYKSKKDAFASNVKKTSNLNKQQIKHAKFNFGGKSNELWCSGGEVRFIKDMIRESVNYTNNVVWFTSLISKKESLPFIERELKRIKPAKIKIVNMQQGNKITRFIAWSFLDTKAQLDWYKKYRVF